MLIDQFITNSFFNILCVGIRVYNGFKFLTPFHIRKIKSTNICGEEEQLKELSQYVNCYTMTISQ